MAAKQPIEIATAKEELVRINDVLKEPVLLIGGLAIQQYVDARASVDLDLVCSHETIINLIRELYPSEDWYVRDINEDDYRPEKQIQHKVDNRPLIRLGPKISERAAYDIDWDDLRRDAVPYRYKQRKLNNILVPCVDRLCVTKLLSFIGRARDKGDKIRQDLNDVVDLSNHPEFRLETFFNAIRRWKVDSAIRKGFDNLTEQERTQFDRSYLAQVAKLLYPFPPALRRQPADLPHQFEDIVRAARSHYYLLGMSAEQIQRSLSLREFVLERAKNGLPDLEMRFLLLHPDSPHFEGRLREVNSAADVSLLVNRKRAIIKTLFADLASLRGKGLAAASQIRFYNAYPIWLLQFIDKRPESAGASDFLALMFHLDGVHAKHSPVQHLEDPNDELFKSFWRYFDHLWSGSSPMTIEGEFPPLHSVVSPEIRLVVFDLDGVIVKTGAAKKAAFMASLPAVDRARADTIYDRHVGLPRRELFRLVLAGVLPAAPEQAVLDNCVNEFERHYDERLAQVNLVPGVVDFLQCNRTLYTYAVASNAPIAEVTLVLRRFALLEYFAGVFGHPISKQDALRGLLTGLKLAPRNAALIGDTEEDATAAAETGVRYFERRDVEGTGPRGDDGFVSFDQLAALLIASPG